MMSMSLDWIRQLCLEKKYSEALSFINDMEASGGTTCQLLSIKAMCLQLVNDGGSLDEVERTFEAALQTDSRCVEALVEFGWFQLNVRDDARTAESLFRKALEIQAAVNTEIISGLIQCQREVSPTDVSMALLSELKRLLINEKKLQELVDQSEVSPLSGS